MSTNTYRVQISRGGTTHGMRHGGMTLCGKRYITALNWTVADTITCKGCAKVQAKAEQAHVKAEQARVKANLANATGLRESQIVIVSKCKCCQVRPIPARTGDPRQDGVLAVCSECAKDLCPGPDVKRYNELVAKFGW